MRRTFISFCAAALLTAMASAPAAAATLRVEFTDFDVEYNSAAHSLTDAQDPDFGLNFDPTTSDPLAAMQFFWNDVLVGSLTTNIYADLAIFGMDPIPAAGGLFNAYGGSLDLLTGSGQGLALEFYDVEFSLFGGGAILSGTATAELFSQLLPFNIVFDPAQPIDVLFVLGPLQNTTTSGGFLTGFTAEGTGKAVGQGNVVPEPTSMLLLGSGLLAAAAARRRARPRQ